MATHSTIGHVLSLERTFAAPREMVFRAWTTASLAKNWWGCNEYPASHMEMDVRAGGVWRACLRADDGSEIWLAGEFIEVVRPERLVFTFRREILSAAGSEPVDTKVTLTFDERDGGTLMNFRQEFFRTAELRDAHHTGWTTGFARLEQIFADQRK